MVVSVSAIGEKRSAIARRPVRKSLAPSSGQLPQLKNWGRFQWASIKVLPHDRILTPGVVSSTV